MVSLLYSLPLPPPPQPAVVLFFSFSERPTLSLTILSNLDPNSSNSLTHRLLSLYPRSISLSLSSLYLSAQWWRLWWKYVFWWWVCGLWLLLIWVCGVLIFGFVVYVVFRCWFSGFVVYVDLWVCGFVVYVVWIQIDYSFGEDFESRVELGVCFL